MEMIELTLEERAAIGRARRRDRVGGRGTLLLRQLARRLNLSPTGDVRDVALRIVARLRGSEAPRETR